MLFEKHHNKSEVSVWNEKFLILISDSYLAPYLELIWVLLIFFLD